MSPLDRLFDRYNENVQQSMTPERARDEMFAAQAVTPHYSDHLPSLPACSFYEDDLISNNDYPYQYFVQGTSNLGTGNAPAVVSDTADPYLVLTDARLPGQGNNWALPRSSHRVGDHRGIDMAYQFWNPTSMVLSEVNAGYIAQQSTNNQACISLRTGNDFGVAGQFWGSTSEVHAQTIAADDLANMTSNNSINWSHGADNSIVPTWREGINSYSQATLSVNSIHGLGEGSLDDLVRSCERVIQGRSRRRGNTSTGLAARQSTTEVPAQSLDAGNLAIMTSNNPVNGSHRGSDTGGVGVADTSISPTSRLHAERNNSYNQATLGVSSIPLGGLSIRSESLIQGSQRRGKGNISTRLADTNTIKRRVGRPKGSTKAYRELRPPTSLKTIHLSLHSIQIGNWERKSKTTTDLLAKCYFGKRKLMWEFLSYDTNLKSRIEVKWKFISSIKVALSPQEEHELLHVELSQPPGFGHETNVTIKRYSPWGPCNDFTDGQASIYRIHNLVFKRGCLFDNFSKMLERSEVLRHLNMKPFPTHPSDRFV